MNLGSVTNISALADLPHLPHRRCDQVRVETATPSDSSCTGLQHDLVDIAETTSGSDEAAILPLKAGVEMPGSRDQSMAAEGSG
jgi:hypothetical protein